MSRPEKFYIFSTEFQQGKKNVTIRKHDDFDGNATLQDLVEFLEAQGIDPNTFVFPNSVLILAHISEEG